MLKLEEKKQTRKYVDDVDEVPMNLSINNCFSHKLYFKCVVYKKLHWEIHDFLSKLYYDELYTRD